MYKLVFVATSTLLLAACQQTAQAPTAVSAPAASAPVQSSTNAYAGRWTGTTALGNNIIVDVPASGTPRYDFRGQQVSVAGARTTGSAMILNLGDGRSTVTLTPRGTNEIDYLYESGGQTTTAILRRS